MGKIIIFLLVFASCSTIEYKYRITGKIGSHEAVWYTDTIAYLKDTAYYMNTDCSIVKIYPPFKIERIK
jgi:hypothetical protein